MSKEKRRRRRRQWSHITIVCSMQFNSGSPIGNFIFFFFFFWCYCICFLVHAQLLLFPSLQGLGMFWSHSIRTSCKIFFPHLVWFNLNIRRKASCTKAPLLIKKKRFKCPIITSKMLQTSLTFDLAVFNSPFDLVTCEKKQV